MKDEVCPAFDHADHALGHVSGMHAVSRAVHPIHMLQGYDAGMEFAQQFCSCVSGLDLQAWPCSIIEILECWCLTSGSDTS